MIDRQSHGETVVPAKLPEQLKPCQTITPSFYNFYRGFSSVQLKIKTPTEIMDGGST
jgi:hypothetical protein